MIYAIFDETNDRIEMVGYATVEYQSSNDVPIVVEVTEEELSNEFVNADVDYLDGAGEPVEAAIDDPLAYRDYLILEDSEITFDEEHSRNNDG